MKLAELSCDTNFYPPPHEVCRGYRNAVRSCAWNNLLSAKYVGKSTWHYQICCIGISLGKAAWHCMWVTLTHFQGRGGHVCVFIREKVFRSICWEQTDVGSPNLVCRYLSWVSCLGLYLGHLDPLSRSGRSSSCIHHKYPVHSICLE